MDDQNSEATTGIATWIFRHKQPKEKSHMIEIPDPVMTIASSKII